MVLVLFSIVRSSPCLYGDFDGVEARTRVGLVVVADVLDIVSLFILS